jgi:hypothetical protein
MKKGFLFILALVVTSVTFISCKRNVTKGKGESDTETRTVGSFSIIQIEAPIKAIIKVDSSASSSFALSGYSNLLKLIKTEVKGNTLRIYVDDLVHIDSDKDVLATITTNSLANLEISGAAEAELHGNITAQNFDLEVSGAGDVTIDNITANTFTANMSGAGDLDIKGGSVTKAVFDVTGAGEVTAFPLAAKQVVANVTGAGDVEVSASEKLEADITGAGSIRYKGKPAITQSIAGAGEIAEAN